MLLHLTGPLDAIMRLAIRPCHSCLAWHTFGTQEHGKRGETSATTERSYCRSGRKFDTSAQVTRTPPLDVVVQIELLTTTKPFASEPYRRLAPPAAVRPRHSGRNAAALKRKTPSTKKTLALDVRLTVGVVA